MISRRMPVLFVLAIAFIFPPFLVMMHLNPSALRSRLVCAARPNADYLSWTSTFLTVPAKANGRRSK